MDLYVVNSEFYPGEFKVIARGLVNRFDEPYCVAFGFRSRREAQNFVAQHNGKKLEEIPSW